MILLFIPVPLRLLLLLNFCPHNCSSLLAQFHVFLFKLGGPCKKFTALHVANEMDWLSSTNFIAHAFYSGYG